MDIGDHRGLKDTTDMNTTIRKILLVFLKHSENPSEIEENLVTARARDTLFRLLHVNIAYECERLETFVINDTTHA